MRSDKRTFVAVYWDFENIHRSVVDDNKRNGTIDIKSIVEYISSFGEINLNRAYSNWIHLEQYRYKMLEHSIDLIQLFPQNLPKGGVAKNGADIRIAIDALEDAFNFPDVEYFVIISGDSDFTGLAQMLRKHGKYVIGIGEQDSTSKFWIKACNEFKFYHNIIVDDTPDRPTKRPPRRDALEGAKRLVLEAIRRLTRGSIEGTVERVAIKPMMLRLDPSFDETSIGFNSFTNFLEACQDVLVLSKGEADLEVRIRDKREEEQRAKTNIEVSGAKASLVQAIREVQENKGNDKPLTTQVKSQMQRVDPNFDYTKQGFKRFFEFLKACEDVVNLKKGPRGWEVTLREDVDIADFETKSTTAPAKSDTKSEATESRNGRGQREERPDRAERSGRSDRRRDARRDDQPAPQRKKPEQAPASAKADRSEKDSGKPVIKKAEPAKAKVDEALVKQYQEALDQLGYKLLPRTLREKSLIVAERLLRENRSMAVGNFDSALVEELQKEGVDAAMTDATKVRHMLDKAWCLDTTDGQGTISLRTYITSAQELMKTVDRSVIHRLHLLYPELDLPAVSELLHEGSPEFIAYTKSILPKEIPAK